MSEAGVRQVQSRQFVSHERIASTGGAILGLVHEAQCLDLQRAVERAGRVIVLPSLRLSERPSEFVDGVEVRARAITVPLEPRR